MIILTTLHPIAILTIMAIRIQDTTMIHPRPHRIIIIPHPHHLKIPIVKIMAMVEVIITTTRFIRRNQCPALLLMLREENGLSHTGSILMKGGSGLMVIGKNNDNPKHAIIIKRSCQQARALFLWLALINI